MFLLDSEPDFAEIRDCPDHEFPRRQATRKPALGGFLRFWVFFLQNG
jgi:hypothetical protein